MKSYVYFFALILTSQAAFMAWAKADEQLQKMTGMVQNISGEKIQVQDEFGHRILELDRNDKDSKIPKDLKKGDQITIWFKVDVEKIAIRKHSQSEKQQPGQIDPSRQKPILDDRVFYSAQKSENIEERNSNSG
jgi:hypothetical protein